MRPASTAEDITLARIWPTLRTVAGEWVLAASISATNVRTSVDVIFASGIGPNRGRRWLRTMLASRSRVEARRSTVVPAIRTDDWHSHPDDPLLVPNERSVE